MNSFIKNGAIFIADSHFNQKNQQLLFVLKKLEKKEIQTKQLFLMGDIIDFISAECNYFVKQNIEIIELLNKLSIEIEIIYLEGNHDFNLKKLFPKINVIKRENQPLFLKLKDKTVCLSHGDNFINWKYELFCKIIRNSVFLKIMNFIDINYFISKRLEKALLEKKICHKIDNFDKLLAKRAKNYSSEIIIEGHYHQGGIYHTDNKEYINIPSLCCQNKIVKLNNLDFQEENICI